MKTEKLGAGIFTIENFLSVTECLDYIALSESKTYEVATINATSGPEINTNIRHNDRVIFDDRRLSEQLYQRAQERLLQICDSWWLTGLNKRFRFYRYADRNYFK